MFHNNIEVAVLVKGRPITEYAYRGQIFIEGRSGSEYEIEIRNNTAGRVEAVISVDGLSVTDGKAAGPQSSGYLIDAHKSVRIPGWTLDNANTAHFAFTGKERSYGTEASGGDSRNNGVIGIMVFNEKWLPRPVQVAQPNYYGRDYGHGLSSSILTPNSPTHYYSGNVGSQLNEASKKFGSSKMSKSRGGPISPNYGEVKTSGDLWNSTNDHYGVTCSANAASSMSYNMSSPRVSATIVDESFYQPEPVQQTLGTAFGDRTEFATTKVEFNRGDMLSMMVLYYDEARGLKARGIQMVRPSRQKYQTSPVAFPAMVEGCKPPHGWKG